MSRKNLGILIFVIIILAVATGSWMYVNMTNQKTTQQNNTSTKNEVASELKKLVSQSSIVIIGKPTDNGTTKTVPGTNGRGEKVTATTYIIDTVIAKKPVEWSQSLGLVISGSIDATGKPYTTSGVPELTKGEEYLIFGTLGQDGFFRPASNGRAIAQKTDNTYTLPADVLQNTTSFNENDLARALASN